MYDLSDQRTPIKTAQDTSGHKSMVNQLYVDEAKFGEYERKCGKCSKHPNTLSTIQEIDEIQLPPPTCFRRKSSISRGDCNPQLMEGIDKSFRQGTTCASQHLSNADWLIVFENCCSKKE